MASVQQEGEGPKLSEIFDSLMEFYSLLETTNEPTSSYDIQKKLQNAIKDGEKAIRMVNDLDLFSTNEEIDEVSSNELRYMLLSALLGHFTGQQTKGDRLDAVRRSQACYIDYLRICRNYGLTNVEVPKTAGDEPEEGEDGGKEKQVVSAAASRAPPNAASMAAMAQQRGTKIERFKQQKEYAAKLNELYEHVQKEHVDDEVKREYYTTLLKKWINSSLDELQSIEMELQILERMAKVKAENVDAKPPGTSLTKPEKKNSTFRPFILTKNDLQKQVYGAGYPSLPTFSIEEFYEQRVREGRMPAPGAGQQQSLLERASMGDEEQLRQQDEAEREKDAKDERDDPDDLKKARNWDDWKDDHRTGWGNTQNKG